MRIRIALATLTTMVAASASFLVACTDPPAPSFDRLEGDTSGQGENFVKETLYDGPGEEVDLPVNVTAGLTIGEGVAFILDLAPIFDGGDSPKDLSGALTFVNSNPTAVYAAAIPGNDRRLLVGGMAQGMASLTFSVSGYPGTQVVPITVVAQSTFTTPDTTADAGSGSGGEDGGANATDSATVPVDSATATDAGTDAPATD